MKIGLLFAGQGAQYSGMGNSLYEGSTAAKEIFDTAGEEVKSWCFEGTKEMLRQTHITQPSIYTVTMAAYEAFMEAVQKEDLKIQVKAGAGFSLGEYAALTASGAIADMNHGLETVTNRGLWMKAAGTDENGEDKGGMIAAFGDRKAILDCVSEVRGDNILDGVNFNSGVQTVVAGDKEALARFKDEAKVRKIKAIPLSVGTAFHSAMMIPAADKLGEYLKTIEFRKPNMKLYSNVTAKDIMAEYGGDVEDSSEISRYIANRMAEQVKSPVYWQETIEDMVEEGIEAVIEIGPGTTLCGIVKKINHEILTLNVEDMESLGNTIKILKERLGSAKC